MIIDSKIAKPNNSDYMKKEPVARLPSMVYKLPVGTNMLFVTGSV
ncbi:hypothetical protein SAMN05216244_3866 [Sediminibacillus halophilus]|uniref:Uncharacterized protein n=1 Tax=Sediminibacillus halophilus TaxID=482461 RepID=A0A1G9XKM2_9BACI|nr:hypothetical protein SAMN05216244_3866 [Sediminibacillus halophilus]